MQYLGGIVADTNDDTPTVTNNLNKAGWGQIHRILSHEEGRNLNAVDQAIIQAIFQCGFKTLVYLKGTNQIFFSVHFLSLGTKSGSCDMVVSRYCKPDHDHNFGGFHSTSEWQLVDK